MTHEKMLDAHPHELGGIDRDKLAEDMVCRDLLGAL